MSTMQSEPGGKPIKDAGKEAVTMDAPPDLARFLSAASGVGEREGVEKWNPPDCGNIDMRIASDGVWLYHGSPIGRPAMVRLFASILRREGNRYVLVTPVEKVGIKVDDVPFLAVEMARDPSTKRLHFRTNLDDHVEASNENPLRFSIDAAGGFRPYVKVRGNLWARLTRSLVGDLLTQAEERVIDGHTIVGISSGDAFFPIAESSAFYSEETA